MRKRSVWSRVPLFLLTLLQLSVPAAAALADGKLGEATAPAHIESHSTPACGRVHPDDCAFHRLLATPVVPSPAAELRIRDGQGIRWTACVIDRSAAPADLTLPDSRAPPTLS